MGFVQETGVYPGGRHTAWVDDVAMVAEVRREGKTFGRRFRGESAWSDAVRKAGDLNQADFLADRDARERGGR